MTDTTEQMVAIIKCNCQEGTLGNRKDEAVALGLLLQTVA